jgi:hypothetical protein
MKKLQDWSIRDGKFLTFVFSIILVFGSAVTVLAFIIITDKEEDTTITNSLSEEETLRNTPPNEFKVESVNNNTIPGTN